MISFATGNTLSKGGISVKHEEEEKKKIPWEAVDPKPPIIQSGHMENRSVNKNIM